MQKQSTVKIRSGKKRRARKKYPFELLKKRGEYFFLAGANAHNMRQAARSYERHHPEIAEAGDRLRVNKEKDAVDDRPDALLVDGATAYRVEREDG